MPYTSHGHAYGLVNADEPRPALVARCGGPPMCTQCAREAAHICEPAELTEAQRYCGCDCVNCSGCLGCAAPEQDEQAEGVQAAPTQTPAGRCSHCQHPINDHSHRRDQKVYADQRRPWCHACNARCDYEQAEGGR